MATIVTRAGKGSPLTNTEVDANFTNLNSAQLVAGGTGVTASYVSSVAVGGTTFAQPAVTGTIDSDQGNFNINYAGATGITVATLSASSTYVYIDKDGALQQQTTLPTREDWTRKIFTMRIAVASSVILGFEYLNNPIGHYANSIRDVYAYLLAQGIPFKKDQTVTGRAADLGFDISAGSLLEFGGTGDIYDPNIKDFSAVSNAQFFLSTRTAFDAGGNTDLPKFWDNNGVLTALGSTTLVGHRLYRFSNGNVCLQYGQGNYANMTLAKSGVALENYVLNPALANATFFGWWFIESTATNTGGTTLTDFAEYTIGIQGGSSGALAGALLKGNNLSDLLDTGAARTNLGLGTGDSPTFAALTSTGEITANGGIALGDNGKATFGAGDDLQIYHNGNNSFIEDVGTGNFYLRAANNIFIEGATANEAMATFQENGFVKLYFDSELKLATTATGIDVTGSVVSDGLTVDGNASVIQFTGTSGSSNVYSNQGFVIDIDHDGDQGGTSFDITADSKSKTVFKVVENGDVSFYEDTGTTAKLTWSASGEDLNFADNVKATFGAGDDLQIYHDGTDSFISDQGTGNLKLLANDFRLANAANNELMLKADQSSAVTAYYAGSPKLATTATGIDVTGTVVADGLQVTNNATSGTDQEVASFRTASGGGLVIRSSDLSSASPNSILEPFFGESLIVRTSGNDRLKVQDNGDVSFYEDTGSTPKMVWDASAEMLTTSGLTVDGSGTIASFKRDAGVNGQLDLSFPAQVATLNASSSFAFQTAATERMRLTATGLGIGTSSPSQALHVSSASDTPALFESTDFNSRIEIKDTGGSSFVENRGGILNLKADSANAAANSRIEFSVDNSEKMRIDSSGNVLVGKSSTSANDVGSILRANGQILGTADDDYVAVFTRNTEDGEIIRIRKNTTTVGSIGSYIAYMYIGSTGGVDTHIGFVNGSVRPATATGSQLDNTLDLGSSGARWQDIYATNATIQTSDRNEKQDIAELSEAEQCVAVACKGLLRKFRWKDSVAEKGDDARIHFGIIAQDLQSAFAAEGLDAGDYAMFISSTWTDEETNEEKTRMGVRYSELLAFIISAL